MTGSAGVGNSHSPTPAKPEIRGSPEADGYLAARKGLRVFTVSVVASAVTVYSKGGNNLTPTAMQTTTSFPDFLPMFESVNRDLWPLHVFTLLLGVAMAIVTLRKSRIADRFSAAALGFIWIFDGVVFHWVYFRPIYEPAGRFAVLWIVQGVLFIVAGVFRPRFSFAAARDGYAAFGFLLIAYALVTYPVLGYLLRSDLAYATWFGPFPCPVAVFTIGMFLLTDDRVPKYLVIVPLLWAVTAWVPVSWGVTEDIGLLVGGTIGMILLFVRDYRERDATARLSSTH